MNEMRHSSFHGVVWRRRPRLGEVGMHVRCLRIALGLGLALAVLCGGCQRGENPPVTLQLAVSPGQGSDLVARANLKRLATQIANEYMRNHPEVLLQLRFLPDADLVESVRSRAQLGAGPDLMISRVVPVEILEREGYLQPVGISRQRLDPLRLQFLNEFRDGNSYEALPFLLQPTVACYNRSRLPKAPTVINDLTARAAEGVRVGLPLQMFELLWTASAFDADQPLLKLFPTRVGATAKWQGLSPPERASVERWLGWLYRANIEPNVLFVETADEMVDRLEKGQLDWISCGSTAIERLKRKLGRNLGVSVLPADSNGKPTRPMARLQLLSFGRDSTPAQRKVATSFALFVLNEFSQSNLIAKAFGNMPVNQNVVVPVKDSPALAAMQASLENSTVPTFYQGVGLAHATEPLRQLIKQAVYGEQTPQESAAAIEAVAKKAFRQDQTKTVQRQPISASQ
jgi:arabinogalactan oligomer/maltooligosaccharide transport system substrate-binding protein